MSGLEKTLTQQKFHLMIYRKQTQKRKNLRSRLPNETTIFQHFRRVSGAYKYMLSYSDNVMEEIGWKNFDFGHNDETKS